MSDVSESVREGQRERQRRYRLRLKVTPRPCPRLIWEPRPQPVPHFLYVVCAEGAEETGPVKVGMSVDPETRLCGLQTGSPVKLTCVWTFECESRDMARLAESKFHEQAAGFRMHGEWVNMSAEDAATMIEALNGK
jgi:hypothetical protein